MKTTTQPSPFAWRGKPSVFATDRRFTPKVAQAAIAAAKAAKAAKAAPQPLQYTSLNAA